MQSAVPDIRDFKEIKTQGPQGISQPQQGPRLITFDVWDTQVVLVKFDALRINNLLAGSLNKFPSHR
jgi:hypothetical protein